MPRTYAITFENVAVTAAQDFFEVLPATQKPVYLKSLHLAQVSDVGDAAEEILRVKVIRGHATSGSGGSAATPRAYDSNDTAAGATCEINNTTIASAGTAVDLFAGGWNVRVPFDLYWPPGERPRAQNANLIVVRLMAAPADSLTCAGALIFEEG